MERAQTAKTNFLLTLLIACLCCMGGSAQSESVQLSGTIRTHLPEVTIKHSAEPVSDVKEVTISVSQNAGICNITHDASMAMNHGSKPLCLIQWDDPKGLTEYLNTLNGVVEGAGEHEFTYSLVMYDLDSFDPIHTSQYSVIFQAPIPPDSPLVDSQWKIRDPNSDTTHDIYNRKESHLSVNAQVTPRNYDQVISFGPFTCTIPDGQTTCHISVDETFTQVDEDVGTKAYPYSVSDPYDYFEKSEQTFEYNWDFRPPTIISTHVNASANMLPQVISDYGEETVVLMHNQAAVVVESPHQSDDPLFYPTDPTLKVRLDTEDLYVTDDVNYGGIKVSFDLGTLYGEQELDIEPINDPLRIGNYLLYVYDFSHIRDGLYDFTFSTKDNNDNGDEETISDVYVDRYPPDIQFVINQVQHKGTNKPNVYSLSDITILAWGGWDDGAEIVSAQLNGEPIGFESGTANVKRLVQQPLPLGSQHYLSVTAKDATGNEYTKVIDFFYGQYGFGLTVDDVMQQVQPAKFLLRQTMGPYCVFHATEDDAMLFSVEALGTKSRGCTINWITKPDGIDGTKITSRSRSTTVVSEGAIADVGAQPYEFEVISYDAFGGKQSVYSASGSFNVTALSPPELYVGPPQIALNYDDYRYALATDKQFSIPSTATGEPGSSITLELYNESYEKIDSHVFEDVRGLSRHFFRPPNEFNLLTAYDYKVKAYYTSAPDITVEKPYKFYTVPANNVRLALEHPDYAMEGTSVQVLAKMGIRQSSDVIYDAAMGEWDVALYSYNTDSRQYEEVTVPMVTDDEGIARIIVSSEQIMQGQGKFIAKAKLRTPYDEINITRQIGALYNVPVLSLGGIDASIQSAQFEAPVPARFIAKVDFASVLGQSTAGDIIWETSEDGVEWTEIGRKLGLTTQQFIMEEPDEMYVRAIVVNRLTSEFNYTNTALFIAKPLPILELTGSRDVAIGGIGTYQYTLNEYAQSHAVGNVEYSLDNKLSWQPMSAVEQLSFESRTNLYARVLINPDGEPPYYIYDDMLVNTLDPRSLNVSFRGDIRNAESGEDVSLTARFLSNTLYQEADFRYEMIMPNGEKHSALSWVYPLSDSDFINDTAVFQFRSWVDGMKLETIGTKTVKVDHIVYDGLPDTNILVQTPERVNFSHINVRLEKPNHASVPRTVEIYEDVILPTSGELELVTKTKYMLKILAKEEGTHPIQVRFYDNRGNERTHIEFVTISEPEVMKFDMKTRYFTQHLRPPFRFSNSLSYRFGSPTDRLDKIEWYLNDQLLFTNKRTILNQTIDEPGEYEIKAKVYSLYGQTAEVSDAFILEENKAPVCEPYWETRSKVVTLFANCSDYDGKVMRVGFNYLSEEGDAVTTYRYFNPSMSFIEGFYQDTSPIEMHVLDDSDSLTTISVDWPEGE